MKRAKKRQYNEGTEERFRKIQKVDENQTLLQKRNEIALFELLYWSNWNWNWNFIKPSSSLFSYLFSSKPQTESTFSLSQFIPFIEDYFSSLNPSYNVRFISFIDLIFMLIKR